MTTNRRSKRELLGCERKSDSQSFVRPRFVLHVRCCLLSRITPDPSLYDVQGKIDTSSEPADGSDVTVINEAEAVQYLDFRKFRLELVAEVVMGRCREAVKKTCARQLKRPCANGQSDLRFCVNGLRYFSTLEPPL